MSRSRIFFALSFCVLSVRAYSQSETMLTGKIIDSRGAGLSGCQVHVTGCEKRDSSDREGVYRIYLLPGKYELHVFRSGSLQQCRIVDIPPVEFCEVDFVLTDRR